MGSQLVFTRVLPCMTDSKHLFPCFHAQITRPSRGWLVVDLIQLSHEKPETIGVMPFEGIFLSDLNPYLSEFRRKPWKTPNGYVDQREL